MAPVANRSLRRPARPEGIAERAAGQTLRLQIQDLHRLDLGLGTARPLHSKGLAVLPVDVRQQTFGYAQGELVVDVFLRAEFEGAV